MECSDRKKKILLYLTEKLMRESCIEIRDTYKGYEAETIEIRSIPGDGPCLFEAEKETIDGHKSLAYKNPVISLPENYRGDLNEIIHEMVHFIQHNDWQMDSSYSKVRRFDIPGFKEFVTQRQETEAHFIQFLFISRYESHLIKPRELQEAKNRMNRSVSHPAKRVSNLVWTITNAML